MQLDASLVVAHLVSQAGISLQPLPTSLDACALNGELLAQVTHMTEPL